MTDEIKEADFLLKEKCMSAPSKVRNKQSVRIRSMQRLTTSIELTTAGQMVTNGLKPVERTCQTATQVKVLSPEIFNITEVDVFHCAEDCMKNSAKVSCYSLCRGLSPWYGMRWILCKLGRSLALLEMGMSEQGNKAENYQMALKKSDWLIVL